MPGDLIRLSLASAPDKQVIGELALQGSAATPVDDFALIEIADGVADAAPLLLISEINRGHRFDAFGYPNGWEWQGNAAHGTIGLVNAVGAVQLNGDADGFPIRAGFSGGPVWDRLAGGIVGIVTGNAADPIRDPRIGFMLPIGAVLRRRPGDGTNHLIRKFDEVEFKALLGELDGPESEARAAAYLGQLLPVFRGAGDDPVARYWIYQALGNVGGSRARAILHGAAETETHDYARFGATEALEIIGAK
ncbi:conserved hypothetical protein [Novosphingobium sp. 9U]|nr:conserved hypothetical protein [Novosphingobium sp. 9U]